MAAASASGCGLLCSTAWISSSVCPGMVKQAVSLGPSTQMPSRSGACVCSAACPQEASSKLSPEAFGRRHGMLAAALVLGSSVASGFGVDWRSGYLAHAAEEDLVKTIRSELQSYISEAMAPSMLRLAFHDAGTFDLESKTGGMNGSILNELDRLENFGLKKPLKFLRKAKEDSEVVSSVSWADLVALAGAEAVAICGGPDIDVKLGRLDSSEPDPEGQIPEETLPASQLKEVFKKKGFSVQELVVLSGAHTIGGKGFGQPTVFDNTYFKILALKPWASGGGGMMGIPSDRAISEDEECQQWIKAYAEDQTLFFKDFSSAYLKMVNSGAQWRTTTA